MKIMIVAPYFYPKIGGLERYALNLAMGLQKLGHDVFVVTTNHDEKKQIEENVQGIRVIRLPILVRVSNTPINPLWYFSLKKIVKAERPDIINAHSPVPFIADMAYCARGKAKFVLTYHAGSLKKGGGPIDFVLGLYEKTFLKHIFLHADEVISVYPAFVRKMTSNAREVHFIPPGADTDMFKPRKDTGKPSQEVMYVGRIELSSGWKGIMNLLRAMSLVVKTNPLATLKLVGNGDALDYYKNTAKDLGLSQHVSFTGTLHGKQLVDAYHQAGMLVLPSETDSEAFGTVLVEAMACGMPVIGSRIGGIPNVISTDKVGLLVTPGDEKALAKAITKLLDNPKLTHTMGIAARAHAVDNFSVASLVSKTDAVFESLHNK